jgi:hypothetical protein
MCADQFRHQLKISFVDYLCIFSYSVFGVDYLDNRDWAHRRNQASAGEAVVVTIFESTAT